MKRLHNSLWRQRAKSVFFFLIVFSPFIFSSIEASDVVQVEPPKTRLIIPPGNSQTGTINVVNSEKQAKQVKVYLEDWSYLPACDGTKDFKPASTTELSAASWISFVPSEFTIPAYGKQALNYTVKVPPEASGGHYAVLFFENYLTERRQIPLEGVSINLALRVASLFYIEPKGTIKRLVAINDIKIEKKKDGFYITADFTNTGNVDITAKSNFFIIDQQGMVYARGDFNDVYTFPADAAILKSSWKETIPRGKYDLILTLDIGKALKDSRLGDFPAITKEAKVEFGENGEVLNIGELR